jgi:hypothetical protein
MSKDYRYQREDWAPVEEDEFQGYAKHGQKRQQSAKTKQMRDIERKEKLRRTHNLD